MTDATAPRNDAEVSLLNEKYGKVKIRVVDRIGIDDVFLHLVQRQLYNLAGGASAGDDVNPTFIDFLIRERFVVR
jgi:hypothetical protein